MNSPFLRCVDSTIAPPLNSFNGPIPILHYDRKQTLPIRSTVHTKYEQEFEAAESPKHEAANASPFEPAKLSQEPSFQIWMSARTHIASLRNAVLITRIDVKRERSQLYRQEEELTSILKSFTYVVENSIPQKLDLHSKHTLNRHSQDLKHCKSDLEVQRQRTAALEGTLSNYEYQLQQVEEDVYFELDHETRRNELTYKMQVQSNSTQTVPPSDSGFDDVAELRERLYSRMGDLRIHLERLNNFEFDLREELEERDLIRASGQTDIITDAQFFEQTRSDRARIQQDVEDAQTDVRELKEHCVRDGVDFEEPDLPDMLFHTETKDLVAPFEPPAHQHQAQRGSSSIIGAFFSAQERVKRWLKEPSGSQNLEKEGTAEIPQGRARRESSSSDMGWVMTPSTTRRPASMKAAGRHGSAVLDAPEWRYGPLPGSALLEALLLESATTPLGKYGHQAQANATDWSQRG